MNTTAFRTVIERGLAAHYSGRYGEALTCYREALALRPDDAEAMSLAGLAMTHLDQAAEALPLLQRAVQLEPGQPGFRMNLAEGLLRSGRSDEALRHLQQTIADYPDNVNAWEKSGDIAASRRDLDGAARAWSQALSLNPKIASPALKLARLELSRNRPDAALQVLESSAARMPDDPTVFALRTEALIARRDWPSLNALALDWTRRQPDSAAAWRAVARAAFELGRYRGASDAFARALTLTSPTAADLTTYGSLCLHALDIDAAAAALDQAAALDPDHTELLSTRGLLNMYLGRFQEAEECCRRSLARNPDNVPAYTTLSRLHRGRLADEDRDAVVRLAKWPDLNLDYRIPAAFAIAHAHDANAQIDQAFAAYEYAHELALERDRLENRRYDRAYVDERRRRLIELSLEPALTRDNAAGGPVPIFIFGMPRSGTTLIESMLSAHSRVFACGERPTMRQILQALLALDTAGRAADISLLGEWATVYMSQLPKIGGADHVTDKHPLNFEAVGLITRMFPDARLIHVRRNPIETGLSIYRQEFNKNWTFPHRLPDIGHYYGHYARLMAHWERALPGRITTIQYEDFARNFESKAPALVAACGLEWEPRCLDFQHTARAITTFSTVQARDPVAVGSGRAQRYQGHLTELVAALEEAGIDLTTGTLRS